ncbi:MAG: asparagine synthetase B, partial [Deltaproteobacteria bacterium]|nr:asparagine synthetase B [Deltaproteobacteria bacterium]
MCAAIHHRGPDATGYGVYGPDALGNTRLKIIDLSAAGNQPISNESRNVHVVHNGEIYNHRELRAALIRDGHRFQGYSDTEVLVHLYEEMGMSFVEKLDGMFALALSDERNQQLVLARDRAGKKPLFYYRSTEIFAFGSEIKALLTDPRVPAEVAVEFLAAYLSFGYVPCPYTLYRGIRQLEP